LNKAFCEFLPLFSRIDELMKQKKSIIAAIDGNSAAGKTSLAAVLKSRYDCNIFSMDDFFLTPHQRTPDRLDEPGGNIDYERFCEEIIEALKSGKPFSYRAYCCQTMKLSEPIQVNPNPLNIIEGAYSLHPYFAGAYDIKVFLRLDEAEQRIQGCMTGS
jgi:uridine kinase